MYNEQEMNVVTRITIGMLSLGLVVLSAANAAEAARLYFDVPEAVPYDETLLVPLRIDAENECINAVELTITYSQETLEAITFARGQSIFSLWPDPPVIEGGAGSVSFSAGIPGGYCGPVMGDQAGTNVVGELALRTLPNEGAFNAVVSGELGFLGEPSVLLHDGFGTPASVTATPASFAIRETGELPRDRWQELLDADTILPENFQIYVHTDASVFSGSPYIVFSTTDKQSGIDYYEVRESDAQGHAPGTNTSATFVRWEGGEPYRLADAEKSIVVVRAYDKAGNAREVVLERDAANGSPIPGLSRLEAMLLGGIAAAIAVLLLALAWAIRRRKMLQDSGMIMK